MAGGRAGYRRGARGSGPRAAGEDFTALADRLCEAPAPPASTPRPAAARPPGPPARETWHAEPVKVFDNLYFVGQTEYSAWAVTTSAGIILIDTIFDYSVEDEVVGGLKKLGLDPGDDQVRRSSATATAITSGGAKFLQDRFNAPRDAVGGRLGSARRDAADVAQAEARHGGDRRPEAHARRHDADDVPDAGAHAGHDLDAHPGHGRRRRRTWRRVGRHGVQLGRPIAPPTSRRSGRRASGSTPTATRRSGSARSRRRPAPTCSSPTTRTSTGRRPSCRRWRTRRAGDPHPYVIGTDAVERYLTVAEECAKAGRLRAR